MLVLQKVPKDCREYFTCCVAFAPSGMLLASSHGYIHKTKTGARGEVKLWDLTTGTDIATVLQCRNFVRAVTFSPDGRLLAAASGDRSIRLFDASAFKEI